MDFLEELKWRGLLNEISTACDELFRKKMVTAYLGIDPTADSLHVGHLASLMLMRLFQRCGHKPIIVIGGATAMIGDPSGKTQERKLLDIETIKSNQKAIKKQLHKFLDFSAGLSNKAELVNNYNWLHKFNMLSFLRDVGKYITINYMISKESVKNRLERGLSFTEFSYQLLQAYDFLYLYKTLNCELQMGGSDQWGNITTGIELLKRKLNKQVHGITCPLITKSDGSKFGKTQEGNVWLDARYTSAYKFYQFWLNTSDIEAEKYIKIFTLFPKEQILSMIKEHKQAPHNRILQRCLARELTTLVHSKTDCEQAEKAAQILFGKTTYKILSEINEKTFLEVFDGVPQYTISKEILKKGVDIISLLTEHTNILPSKSETRRLIKCNGLSINKKRIDSQKFIVNFNNTINQKYIIIQKGKKNYSLIKII